MGTTAKLEQLTDTQWQQIYDTRDQWLARGMATGRTDRAPVEDALARIYATEGHPRPVFVWADSPRSALLMAAICRVQLGAQLGAQLGDQLWAQLRVQLWAQLRVQLWDQLGAQLRVQLGAQLWDQLGVQLGDQLRVQLGAQLWAQLGDQLWAQLRVQLGDQLGDHYRNTQFSGWDMAWLAFYAIPRDLGHVAYPSNMGALLDDFATVAYGATSWTPYSGICFLSDMPTQIRMTGTYSAARLHSPDGPAIQFSDGWAVHAWHGRRVPASLVTGGGWSIRDIVAEGNLEIRRCAIERMGWDQFIEDADLRPVNTCPDPGNPGFALALYDLPENLNPYEEPVRMLLCANATEERDGTRRRFGISVPADVPDALSAAAWTFDLTPGDYAQLQHAY